jgi:hypothetical protein
MPCPPLPGNQTYVLGPAANVRVTHSAPDNARSESCVVVNPNDVRNLICASKKFFEPTLYHGTISTSYSTDGGTTWTESEPALEGDWDGMTDPDLTFDAAGNAYLIVEPLKYDRGSIITIGMYVYTSTDGGRTWENPVQLHLGADDDKQWIEADTSPMSPYFGTVYAVWGAPTPLRFARSTDQGATWRGVGGSPPGADVVPEGCFAPSLAIGEDGTIHVSWHIPGSTEIRYTRSTDGGDTFSPVATAVTNVRSLSTFLPITDGWPHFSSGQFRVFTIVTSSAMAGNKLIVAWPDFREGVSRIYYRVATDSGTTWLGPPDGQPLLARYGGAQQQHFHPQVVQAGIEAVGCVFYEFGPKPDWPMIEVLATFSCSDADGFHDPVTVSDQPWDPAINPPWARGDPAVKFIGDYIGLCASYDWLGTVWTDTRTGTQELRFDRITVGNELVEPLGRIPAAIHAAKRIGAPAQR